MTVNIVVTVHVSSQSPETIFALSLDSKSQSVTVTITVTVAIVTVTKETVTCNFHDIQWKPLSDRTKTQMATKLITRVFQAARTVLEQWLSLGLGLGV